jgi:endonuclease IV
VRPLPVGSRADASLRRLVDCGHLVRLDKVSVSHSLLGLAVANRNETKHLPYGEGTLRADPLREALAAFERPATVISESSDEASSQMIRTALTG